MKSSRITGFFANFSRAPGGLQRLDRLGMTSNDRVSRPRNRDGMGSRNGLLALFFLLGAVCSIWTFWLLEDFRFAGKKVRGEGFCEESVEVPPAQHNLSNEQLQALALLFSSVDQGIFYECLKKSLVDVDLNNSLISALEVLHNESDQFPIRDNTIIEGWLPTQDDSVTVDPMDLSAKDQVPSANFVKDYDVKPYKGEELSPRVHHKKTTISFLGMPLLLVMGIVLFSLGSFLGRSWKFSRNPLRQKHCQRHDSSCSRKWMKRILVLGVLAGLLLSLWIFFSMKVDIMERRKETLANMCDERARMLQDQFNVSMNHVHALAILVSTFHHGKNPSAIDQKTFEEFTARTEFERPLMSGVAYALKVLHSEREEFEMEHGWKIKKMETEDHSPVQDDYFPEKLEPSPVQEEYAPVIFTQETVSHIVSIDMMSGKQDRENILRARATGKGVLTFPFDLLKSNRLGVVLTFAVYNSDLSSNATPQERIEATVGYLGASFDVASLVEKLLQQLSSKQTIVVNLYDTTYASAPMMMYSCDTVGAGEVHVSKVDLGDPTHNHEMHCRFKHKHPLPWSAISTSLSGVIIVLLIGYIIHAALNRIEEVEDDYLQMKELKIRAEAADVAKSQFLATVSHEIRTPMNGVLGMLQMLMDTELDATQQDYAMTAQSSGKALIALINEVLDLAKIESGRLELEAVPFDVRDVLDNVLSLFSDKSQAKKIELAVHVSDGVPEVLIGDPGRFRQVITNLVGNSVKFTEEGHIFVSVHLVDEVNVSRDFNNHISEGDIEVSNGDKKASYNTLSGYFAVDKQKSLENFSLLKSSSESSGTINLVVKVEDTGVGIPEEAQRRVFTPFMQADSSTSRTYGGTGIGLSISKCLVNLMGGEIIFESKPGVGSTFTFTAVFNGGKSSNGTKKHITNSISSNFNGMRGLVVDGRIIRADVAKYHLQRLGIHVKTATTQESAKSAIIDACNSSGKEHLDMVFVDKDAWGKGSGLAFPHLLVELKQNGVLKLKGMPKIFLLATSLSLDEVEDLKSAGYADTIMKPLRLSMISACLRKTLGVENQSQQVKGQPVALRNLLKGKNILVVDDNTVNRIVAAGVLKKFGAIVKCTESGKAAIRLLQPPHSFDACFMDVQMPEMDGFEATRQIRSMESKVNELIKSGEAALETYGNVAHWHVPILAMTADVIQATYEQCIRCGMDDYVSKPFEEQQLYSAVAHFFESDMVEADS